MNYLGRYSDFNIPISSEDYGQLFAYTDNGMEVVIYYDRKKLYWVKYIALLIEQTETYSTYELYEHEYYGITDSAVKTYISSLVEELLKLKCSHL